MRYRPMCLSRLEAGVILSSTRFTGRRRRRRLEISMRFRTEGKMTMSMRNILTTRTSYRWKKWKKVTRRITKMRKEIGKTKTNKIMNKFNSRLRKNLPSLTLTIKKIFPTYNSHRKWKLTVLHICSLRHRQNCLKLSFPKTMKNSISVDFLLKSTMRTVFLFLIRLNTRNIS